MRPREFHRAGFKLLDLSPERATDPLHALEPGLRPDRGQDLAEFGVRGHKGVRKQDTQAATAAQEIGRQEMS